MQQRPGFEEQIREGSRRVRARHPDFYLHEDTMKRITAILTGEEVDSFYFELYIESLYQTNF